MIAKLTPEMLRDADAALASIKSGHKQADRTALQLFGNTLLAFGSTVDAFQRNTDNKERERIRGAARTIRPRYSSDSSLVGFIRDIGGKAINPKKLDPIHDADRMRRFIGQLASYANPERRSAAH